MNAKAIFCDIVFFAMLAFAYNANAGGFGISPPLIVSDNLLKGSRLEQTVYLVQSEPNRDLEVEAVVLAPEIGSWISIDKGTSFILPKGEKQFPITVAINVPEDAAEGKYKGYININTKSAEIVEIKDGSNISINLGGRIDIDLTVGNNIVEEYKILSIDIKDIESNWSPLAVLKIQNTGNVAVKLNRATFDLFDKYNSVRLGFGQTEEFQPVPPYSIKEVTLNFPIDLKLGLGEYSGTVRVYKDEKIIKELQTSFNVVEKGTLSGSNEESGAKNKGIISLKNILAVLSFFLVAAAIIILLKNNNIRSKLHKILTNNKEEGKNIQGKF